MRAIDAAHSIVHPLDPGLRGIYGAIFTGPAHPNWGGTAVIGPAGDLVGIGSLQIQQAAAQKRLEDVNMVVPIDLLKPILDDLLTIGRANASRASA